MKKIIYFTLAGMALLMGTPAPGISQETAGAQDIVIIVNRGNPVQSIKKSLLRRYFLRKTTEWTDGTAIVPVDLPASDPIRERFSEWILKQTPARITGYWISQGVTGGKDAPDIVRSAAAVKNHVANHAGGIGYILRSDLDGSVKAIEVFE